MSPRALDQGITSPLSCYTIPQYNFFYARHIYKGSSWCLNLKLEVLSIINHRPSESYLPSARPRPTSALWSDGALGQDRMP